MRHDLSIPAGIHSIGEGNSRPANDVSLPAGLSWHASSPRERGPIIGGLQPARNAIGIHAGSFAPYRAIAVATGALSPDHSPDLSNTSPSATIGPFTQWSTPGKIVALDPWGHRVGEDFADEIASGLHIQPSIAITSGRLLMPEIAEALRSGRLLADDRVLDSLGGVLVTKIAMEPVWWLPGVASRLGISEKALREALVEASGGMYPDLIERPDIKVFLPPIGGTSVYLFGDPTLLGNMKTTVTCRVHDECNGSDVFGSDMCTCRAYLGFAAEECVRAAQAGEVGIIAYNRKEGRALGEVIKYLVYNSRRNSSCGDTAESYFSRTENLAGIRDARCQELAVDVLHWLGVSRINSWLSMSNHKRDAILAAGIDIEKQVELPPARVAPGATVEISAKKASGYFSALNK
ncbi:GTP cyclohydrolase II [Pararhizobium sp. O133]|uniref:GTP cyclohydrolase II n=1 Tax=Pararhizobium sp. O133 TaxID=3449278 RepID=UPI003F68497F